MSATDATDATDATTIARGVSDERDEPVSLSFALFDTLALTKRNLLHLFRETGLLVFTFVQPVMFVLLFRYVFGETLGRALGLDYVSYLMPGVFVQAVAVGSASTAIGLAEDLGGGIMERFRSLPMVRLSVLAARTLADMVRNVGVIAVMFVVGILVGFRPHSVGGVVAAGLLILAFAFSLSWVMSLVGLRSSSAEEAQSIAFPFVFPLTFASSAFVPVESLPSWMQGFAEHQPVTAVVNAARDLMLGPAAAGQAQAAASSTTTREYVVRSVLWIVVLLAGSVPLAIRRFNRR